ncbi:MAG: hypothetical protein ACI9N0_003274, partial [Ilumatobacter sp.]
MFPTLLIVLVGVLVSVMEKASMLTKTITLTEVTE